MLVTLADFACYMLCTDTTEQTCQLSSLSHYFWVEEDEEQSIHGSSTVAISL